ncbi:hypothetical protein [Methanoculleus sp. MH98A]|nr:hypothetical protein [Methanoculleus sp. MH98A]
MAEERRKKPNPAERFCRDADDIIVIRKREEDEPKPDGGIVY